MFCRVNFFELLDRDVGIELCGLKALIPQHVLDKTDVGVVFKQVRCKRVA